MYERPLHLSLYVYFISFAGFADIYNNFILYMCFHIFVIYNFLNSTRNHVNC